MSVVNKMLNDLEQRGHCEGTTANYVPPRKTSRVRMWVWAIVVVLSLAVLAMLMMPAKQTAVNTVPAKAVPTATMTADEPAETQMQVGAAAPEPVSPPPSVATRAADRERQLPAQSAPSPNEQAVPGSAQAPNVAPTTPATEPATPQAEGVLSVSSDAQAIPPNAGLRERIRLALEAGHTLNAIALMQELLVREPDNLALTKKLAATLFAEGQTSAARQLLAKQVSARPGVHSLRLMLARLHVHQGQNKQAVTVLDAADAYPPVSPALLAYRGELLRDMQLFERALSDYVQLTAREPGNARWWLGLGVSADALGQARQAHSAFTQALAMGQLDREVAAYMRQRMKALGGGKP